MMPLWGYLDDEVVSGCPRPAWMYSASDNAVWCLPTTGGPVNEFRFPTGAYSPAWVAGDPLDYWNWNHAEFVASDRHHGSWRGGSFTDSAGGRWIQGVLNGSTGGGFPTVTTEGIPRWTDSTGQMSAGPVPPDAHADPFTFNSVGGALRAAADAGDGGFYFVSGTGSIYWTDGSSVSGSAGAGDFRRQTSGSTPYVADTLKDPDPGGPWPAWYGFPAGLFFHNGAWWCLASGIWAEPTGGPGSGPPDFGSSALAFWRCGGDPTDPTNWTDLVALIAGEDLTLPYTSRTDNGVYATSSQPGSSGAWLQGGVTYVPINLPGGGFDSTHIIALVGDSVTVSRTNSSDEIQSGGICDLAGTFYTCTLTGDGTLRLYSLSGGSWGLVSSYSGASGNLNLSGAPWAFDGRILIGLGANRYVYTVATATWAAFTDSGGSVFPYGPNSYRAWRRN